MKNDEPLNRYIASIFVVAGMKAKGKLTQSDVGRMGGMTSGAMKTLKIELFLNFFENYTKEEGNLTLAVGRKLANKIINSNSNQNELNKVFSTDRTGADKVDVDEVVERILKDPSTIKFKAHLARTLTKAEKTKDHIMKQASKN